MTSITNLLTSSNYQYSSQKTEESEAVKQTTTVTEKSAASGSLGGAYNLDLSEEALAYLKSLEETQALPKDENKNYGFKLTEAEQKQLDEIISKYTSMPYTQENFDKLQQELKSARLDSLNMAAKDLMRNFNATSSLMEALSGNSTFTSAGDRLKGQEGNSETFMNQVASDWYNQIMLSDV